MHVVLNMACSVDGRVAGAGGEPVQLSGSEDLARVHRLRARSDAILVGVGTVLADDPRLTARPPDPPDAQPLRVVLDHHARTPPTARVVDDAAPSLVLTQDPPEAPIGEATVDALGGRLTPERVLDALADRGIERLLVEGGPTVAGRFLDAGAIDRFSLYIAPRVLGEGPTLADGLEGLSHALEPRARAPLGEGTLVCYEGPG